MYNFRIRDFQNAIVYLRNLLGASRFVCGGAKRNSHTFTYTVPLVRHKCNSTKYVVNQKFFQQSPCPARTNDPFSLKHGRLIRSARDSPCFGGLRWLKHAARHVFYPPEQLTAAAAVFFLFAAII